MRKYWIFLCILMLANGVKGQKTDSYSNTVKGFGIIPPFAYSYMLGYERTLTRHFSIDISGRADDIETLFFGHWGHKSCEAGLKYYPGKEDEFSKIFWITGLAGYSKEKLDPEQQHEDDYLHATTECYGGGLATGLRIFLSENHRLVFTTGIRGMVYYRKYIKYNKYTDSNCEYILHHSLEWIILPSMVLNFGYRF